MVKANPPTYCAWCEEKLATKEQYPYCSRFCRNQHPCKQCGMIGHHKMDCSNQGFRSM